MRQRYIMFGLVLLLITACAPGTTRPLEADYKQGYEGLRLELLPNYPPREILEGGTFTIAVQVNNGGAYDTTRGEVSIFGLSEALNSLEKDFDILRVIKGKNINNPSGEFYIEEFNGKNIVVPPGMQEYPAKFWVQAEYDYHTVLNTDVCINTAMLKIEADASSCVVDEEQSFSGQGAPITITSVKELVNSEGDNMRAQFTLKVENRGGGDLISPVIIDSVRIANRRLNCERRELEAELVEKGDAELVCTFIEPNRGAYKTVLSATLYYTYRTIEKGEITVKRLGD